MLSEQQNSLITVPCWPNGIDISNHQPQFDWAAWNGHIQFASVKATEGLTFQDAWFGYNWEWMEKIGVFRFAYHYAHPNLDPVKQAKFLVDYVKLHGLKRHDNFVLDLEETNGRSPREVSFWAWVFCHTINQITGQRVLVYTYPSFAEAGNCAMLGGWGLWIANYGVPQPTVPAPWKYWRFWQYTSDPLDLDRWNGDEMTLAQYCAR